MRSVAVILALALLVSPLPLRAQAPPDDANPDDAEPEKVLPTIYAVVFPPALSTKPLVELLNAEDEKLVDVTDAVGRGKLDLEAVDVLIVHAGALVPNDRRVARVLTDGRPLVADFVARGGVLVVLTNADDVTPLAFLPRGMTTRVSKDNHLKRVPVDARHPLLGVRHKLTPADLGERKGTLYPGGCYVEYRGLVPVVAYDRRGRYPIILEASSGKGRVILMHLMPVRALARGDAKEKSAAKRLVANLLDVIRGTLKGEVRPTVAWVRHLRVTVFEDTNADGRRDTGEPPVAKVNILGTLEETGADGACEIRVEPWTEFVSVRADLAKYRLPFHRVVPPNATRLDVGLVPRTEPFGEPARLARLVDDDNPHGTGDVDDAALRFMLGEVARVVPKVDVLVLAGDVHTAAPRWKQVKAVETPFEVLHDLRGEVDADTAIATRDAVHALMGPRTTSYKLRGDAIGVGESGSFGSSTDGDFGRRGLGALPGFRVFPPAARGPGIVRYVAGLDRHLAVMYPAPESSVAAAALEVSVSLGDTALGPNVPIAVKLAHVRRIDDRVELVPIDARYDVVPSGDFTRKIAFTRPAVLDEGFYVMRLSAGNADGRHWGKTVTFVVPHTPPAGAAFEKPWRDVGGDALHCGEAPDTLAPPFHLARVTNTDTRVLRGCPIIVGEQVLLKTVNDASIYCGETGQFTLKRDGLVRQAEPGPSGTFRYDFGASMPDIGATHLLVGGDFLCVVDAQGAAWGFKRAPKTAPAKPSWHRDVAPGCRQAVATDLYLYTGNECLETATGRLQWRLKTHVLRDVHVALLGEHIVLTGVTTRGAPARQVLLLVKRGSGEIAWEKTLAEVASRDEVLTPPPTVARGTVFCGSADGVLRAFRLSDGAELWRYQTGPSLLPLGADERRNAPRISSQAVVSGRWVIVAGYDGRLVVLNRKTGKLRWQTPLGLPVAASPAVSGNALCLVDCDGNVFTFVGAAGRR